MEPLKVVYSSFTLAYFTSIRSKILFQENIVLFYRGECHFFAT